MNKGLRNAVKKCMNRRILPGLYRREAKRTKVQDDLAVFVSAHGGTLSANQRIMRKAMQRAGFRTLTFCREVDDMRPDALWKYLKRFIRAYASCRFLFLDSYFLPVSSCRKRKETTVIQLWHSGGLLKKMGYDTAEDLSGLPAGFTDNYDLVTVSAPSVEHVWEKALGLRPGTAEALGLPRTDRYFSSKWKDRMRERFYAEHPETEGKKVAVYAPSFSGHATHPDSKGRDGARQAAEALKEEWAFVFSPHPLTRSLYPEREMALETEELLPVADLLITDYSSVAYDAMLMGIPVLFFCPDIEMYRRDRGFYLDPAALPCGFAETPEEMIRIMQCGEWKTPPETLKCVTEKYMSACDGHAAERIIRRIKYTDK